MNHTSEYIFSRANYSSVCDMFSFSPHPNMAPQNLFNGNHLNRKALSNQNYFFPYSSTAPEHKKIGLNLSLFLEIPSINAIFDLINITKISIGFLICDSLSYCDQILRLFLKNLVWSSTRIFDSYYGVQRAHSIIVVFH